jgi:hypothetical protein
MEPDFTGYVTKYGVRCTDGRTILAHAFKANDGAQIPLVWQHQHGAPDNVLGHLILTHVNDGVRVGGYFNNTPAGLQAKALVMHKDINALSIYANQLVQKDMNVVHGNIREGSLVLAGANPGAFIDNVNVSHSDGNVQVIEEEAVIYCGEELELSHAVGGLYSQTVSGPKQVGQQKGAMPIAPSTSPSISPSTSNEKTVQDVFDSLDQSQRDLLFALVGATAQQGAVQSDTISADKDGGSVTRNVFDKTPTTEEDKKTGGSTLSHSDIKGIFDSAHKSGSLKSAVEEFAIAHGIDDISTLFPYDQAVTTTPEFISRRMEWVAGVLGGVHKTPFSRIRSWTADITIDEARAKGYVKGSLKREEFFRIARRITTPQTVYKKQKLDRDDIIDITDFDVVAWLQTEMRIMLDEELARAILIGDGRDIADPDKISADNVRPIYGDEDLYATTVNVDLADTDSTDDEIVDGVVKGMQFYYGSGEPVLYTSLPYLTRMLLIKDTLGRRIYATKQELASALGVRDVIPVQVMEQVSGLIGIVVNLNDYTVGADRGGQVSMFDFFDIDYNQFKYLMECRMSGALTKYRCALIIKEFSGAGGLLPDPTIPSFDDSTGVGTIPTVTHVTYVTVDPDTGVESSALSAGAQTAIASGEYVTYRAKPASTYEFATDAFEWTFRRI